MYPWWLNLWLFSDIAENDNITISGDTPADYFSKLITSLSKEKQVVVLIDEYDKPLLDNLMNNTLCKEIRDILRDFYAVLKTNDKHIKKNEQYLSSFLF